MRLVNLTPHPIHIDTPAGTVEIPSSGLARVTSLQAGEVGRIALPNGETVPVHGSPAWGVVEGLPGPEVAPGAVYIVSLLVLDRCAGRDDVVAPATGPNDGARRNEKGQIAAVTRLVAPAKN